MEIPGDLANEGLPLPPNPNGRPNSDVVRPWVNAMDLTRRSRGMYIIDFGVDMPAKKAALYQAPFEYILQRVKPERDRSKTTRAEWWLHERPRPEMRTALGGLPRFLSTPRVAKHRVFVWLPPAVLADSATIVFARDDDYFFGVLQSRFHEAWALRQGTSLEDRPRYTPTTTFETYPLPIPSEPQRATIARAAADLERLRNQWLNPNGASAGELKKRTLTNLYNERPAWLANAHAALDVAVAEAYGWAAEIPEDEVLSRLLALNEKRTPG